MDYEKCSSKDGRKIISVKERGKTFSINNTSHKTVCVIKIDGCLIGDDREHCDYAFEIDEPFTSVIYVELKGGHIKKAYPQLVSTLEYCIARHGKSRRSCYIVCSRVAGTDEQKLKVKMSREYSVLLRIKRIRAQLTI